MQRRQSFLQDVHRRRPVGRIVTGHARIHPRGRQRHAVRVDPANRGEVVRANANLDVFRRFLRLAVGERRLHLELHHAGRCRKVAEIPHLSRAGRHEAAGAGERPLVAGDGERRIRFGGQPQIVGGRRDGAAKHRTARCGEAAVVGIVLVDGLGSDRNRRKRLADARLADAIEAQRPLTREPLVRRIGHAARALAPVALRAVGDRSTRCRIAPAVPAGFQHTDTFARSNHLSVVAHDARANGNERADVVIEGIHFRDGARLQAVDVRQRDRRRRIEHCASRLNRDDEPRLLPETGDHRDLVSVDDRHAHTSRFRAARERHLTGLERQRETRRFRNRQRAAARRRADAKLVRRVQRQQVNRLPDGVVLAGHGDHVVLE